MLLALLDRDATPEEITDRFVAVMRRFGFHSSRWGGRTRESVRDRLEPTMAEMEQLGMLKTVEDRLCLTEKGRGEAERIHRELEETGRRVDRALTPERASLVTLLVHFALAALKIPAALVSGSVGLLSDAMDTLLDGVSSLLVHFGIRRGKERLVNVILVVLMSLTALYALAETIQRIFRPRPPEGDVLAFVSVAVSSVVCAGLFAYQRSAGARSGCAALITQSVDSRNHVIAALSAGAGLAAARFGFPWLDVAVGLTVALLIAASALELLREMIRNARDGRNDTDYARYGLFAGMQERQAALSLASMVTAEAFPDPEALRQAFAQTLSKNADEAVQALGLWMLTDPDSLSRAGLRRALDDGLIQTSSPLSLTPAGTERLRKTGLLPIDGSERRIHRQGAFHTITALLTGAVLYFVLQTAFRYAVRWIQIRPLWGDGPLGDPRIPMWLGYALGGIIFCTAHVPYRHAVRHIRRVRRGDQIPSRLERDGPYARVRHPMYAGMILQWAALAVGFGCRLSVLAAAGIAGILGTSTLIEDRRLENRIFPEAYPEYRSEVPSRLFTPLSVMLLVLMAAWAIGGLVFLGPPASG